MKLILYNLVKPLRAFELWVMVIGYILYVLCLLYFSSFFDSQIERVINLKDNQIYYQNQSSYFIWVMLGVVIVIKSHHIIMANELNLWVILKSEYLYAKFIAYYIELFIVFVIVYGTYQLIHVIAFDTYVKLENHFYLIGMNALVFSSFMVLWIRIQSKYTLMLGYLLVVLLPSIDLTQYEPIRLLLPYNLFIEGIKVVEVLSVCTIYNIFGLELQKLKIN